MARYLRDAYLDPPDESPVYGRCFECGAELHQGQQIAVDASTGLQFCPEKCAARYRQFHPHGGANHIEIQTLTVPQPDPDDYRD